MEIGKLEIDAGCLDGLVAKQDLDRPKISSVVKHVGAEAMAKSVGRDFLVTVRETLFESVGK